LHAISLNWTSERIVGDSLVRQPRADKPAREIVKEVPKSTIEVR